jgi:hypothetical protein
MLDDEQEPKKKKRSKLLSDKMGLDKGSVEHAPPMAQPGIFPGSAAGELNERSQDGAVGAKVQDKLKSRRIPNGR